METKLFAKHVTSVVHRKLQLAAAYCAMTQSDFLARAIDESITKHNIPIGLMLKPSGFAVKEEIKDESGQ